MSVALSTSASADLARADRWHPWATPGEADHTMVRFLAIILVVFTPPSAVVYVWSGHLFSRWWNTAAWVLLATPLVLAIAVNRLSTAVLRAACLTLPLVYIGLHLVSYFGFSGDPATAPSPWMWFVEVGVVGLLTVVMRARFVIAGLLVSAAAPALSSLMALGTVSLELGADAVLHLGNLVPMLLLIGARAKLNELRRTQRASQEQQHLEWRAIVHRRNMEAFARTIHDHVLGTLAASLRFDEPPDELKQAARRSLEVLNAPAGPETDETLCLRDAVGTISEAILTAAPGLRISARYGSGTMPWCA